MTLKSELVIFSDY